MNKEELISTIRKVFYVPDNCMYCGSEFQAIADINSTWLKVVKGKQFYTVTIEHDVCRHDKEFPNETQNTTTSIRTTCVLGRLYSCLCDLKKEAKKIGIL